MSRWLNLELQLLLHQRNHLNPPQSLTSTSQTLSMSTRIDKSRAQPCSRVVASESEDETTIEFNVAELNRCLQDHLNAFRSRPTCYMLSDTKYSDFDESDGDEGNLSDVRVPAGAPSLRQPTPAIYRNYPVQDVQCPSI